MKIAIYARKSRYTGKGESVANQIEECKEYCRYKFHNEAETEVFQDEGYSGKNLERPAMYAFIQRMEEFDYLICYRLDRVSRSVGDFSGLIQRLEQAGVQFVSVSEEFDTSKPMGRAMMNIASTFAELERDTLRERIVDNMSALARKGHWLGGTTPLGYRSKKICGQGNHYYQLEMDEDEASCVELIYHLYDQFASISEVRRELKECAVKSRQGNYLGNYCIRYILQNPVYCQANQEVYDYLQTQGYQVEEECERFDGRYGLTAYNKSGGKRRQHFRKPEEWIVSIGGHQAIVDSKLWISVQKKLASNRVRRESGTALLSGLIFCECGGKMRPKNTGTVVDGIPRFRYLCVEKSESHGGKCTRKNLPGNEVDEQILRMVKELFPPENTYEKLQEQMIAREYKNKKRQYERWLGILENNEEPALEKLIVDKWEELFLELKALEEKERLVQEQEIAKEECENLAQKRACLRKHIEKIIWDGSEATIYFAKDDVAGRLSTRRISLRP